MGGPLREYNQSDYKILFAILNKLSARDIVKLDDIVLRYYYESERESLGFLIDEVITDLAIRKGVPSIK